MRWDSGQTPRRTRGRIQIAVLMLGGVLLLLAAIAARQTLYRSADRAWDAAPLPRPKMNAPYITTPDAVVQAMLELARLRPQDLVYDLGCGDGRLVIAAAARHGCHGRGFDIDPERVQESVHNAEQAGVEALVQFEQRDVFTVDLSEADVVLAYLLPWMLTDLRPQFETMRPGSRIVTHDFWMDGVRPDQQVEIKAADSESGKEHVAYLYLAPLQEDPGITQNDGPPEAQPRTTSP